MAKITSTLLTFEKAAKTLGVSESLLRQLAARREVSSTRIGMRSYFVRDELERELWNRGRKDAKKAAS
jgi:excisionase family DNA binding protein